MDDVELVRATRTGDLSAFTAIFDRHAARVHDLALAMLRDRGAALEVVEQTFLEASLRLHGLEEAHRLPVWLLAVTRRNGALRAGPTAGVDRQPSLPNDDPERVHLAGLVWEAVADLPLRDRTLLDLDLRQGLDGQDLADALGVTITQAQDLQARMRDRIEKGLSGYLIARTTDGRCPDLTKVLKGWDGRFTPKDSRRIAGHVDGCRVCNQTRFAMPSPFALYAAALPAPFPAAVRARIIERVVLPGAAGGMPGVVPGPPPSPVPDQAFSPTAAYQSPMPVAPPPEADQAAPFPAPSPDQAALPEPTPQPEAYPGPPTEAHAAPQSEAYPGPQPEAYPAQQAEASPAQQAEAYPAQQAEASPAQHLEAAPQPEAEPMPQPEPAPPSPLAPYPSVGQDTSPAADDVPQAAPDEGDPSHAGPEPPTSPTPPPSPDDDEAAPRPAPATGQGAPQAPLRPQELP